MNDKNFDFTKEKEPMMVQDEAVAYATVTKSMHYAEDLRQGMEILSKSSPEELHILIKVMLEQQKVSLSNRFNSLFDAWWNETCLYSGANLCYSNSNFQEMKQFGPSIGGMIEEKAKTCPDYMQRHIKWLKQGLG